MIIKEKDVEIAQLKEHLKRVQIGMITRMLTSKSDMNYKSASINSNITTLTGEYNKFLFKIDMERKK
jgi:hypothetical protein